MTSSRRVHVVVAGRVQGVFYRASCAREAQTRAIAGWVRNRGDGCVEATFEGDADAVAALIAWCHRGPVGASVSRVDVTDEEPIGERAFRVMGRVTG